MQLLLAMAAQVALPPDLTEDDIHYILESLDVYLNSIMLQIFMYGEHHSSWKNPLTSEQL